MVSCFGISNGHLEHLQNKVEALIPEGCVSVYVWWWEVVVTILKSHKLKNKMGPNIFLILVWQFRIYA